MPMLMAVIMMVVSDDHDEDADDNDDEGDDDVYGWDPCFEAQSYIFLGCGSSNPA